MNFLKDHNSEIDVFLSKILCLKYIWYTAKQSLYIVYEFLKRPSIKNWLLSIKKILFAVMKLDIYAQNRCDAQLNNHCTLCMNSMKDNQSKIDFCLSKRFFAVIKLDIYA